MPRNFLPGPICFLLLCTSVIVLAQAPAPPPQAPADPMAVFLQAAQAKDWTSAITAAQQFVQASPTADHLRLLGDAQLNAGAMSEADARFCGEVIR